MFSTDVVNLFHYFEAEKLQSTPHPICPVSRIDMSILGFNKIVALGSLFQLSNSSKQYRFSYITPNVNDKENQDQGIVSICGRITESGKKVDATFMNLFKKDVISFSASLSTYWIPCSKEDVESDSPFLSDIIDQDYIVSKQAGEGTRILYQFLNEENGSRVKINGFYKDYIAGSKENVESFLNHLHVVGESIKSDLN